MAKLSTVLAAMVVSTALFALPAQARDGGGFHGGGGGGWHGGGFHGHDGFHGGFHDHDHFHHFHNRFFFGFGGFGLWDPFWYPWGWGGYPYYPYAYGYDPFAYPYGYPYPAAQYPLAQAPAAPAQNVWYYCRPSNAYYPYVQSCAEAWQQVPTRPQ